jgi:hypothetical protein
MRASRLTTVLVMGSLALVAGCGGDEETTSTATDAVPTETAAPETSPKPEAEEIPVDELTGLNDDQRIVEGAMAFLVSSDSEEVCEELVTDALLRQSYGGLQGCLQGRPKPSLANGGKLGQPKIDGGTATVVATPDGGLYDGVEVNFTFVLEGDTWLIDSVSADIPVGP